MPKSYSDIKHSHIKATSTRIFKDGDKTITVEISDTATHFCWRMKVSRHSWTGWYFFYEGILFSHGYGVCSAYWSGSLPEFVPFKITELKEAKI